MKDLLNDGIKDCNIKEIGRKIDEMLWTSSHIIVNSVSMI